MAGAERAGAGSGGRVAFGYADFRSFFGARFFDRLSMEMLEEAGPSRGRLSAACPTSEPGPGMKLITPSGSPASCQRSMS